MNSTEADVYCWRGESKYYLGQLEEAILDFDDAIKLKDGDLYYYRLRGYAKLSLNQYEEARADIKDALKLAQQSEDALLINIFRSRLREIDLQLTQGGEWTLDRFKELVPEDMREHYDSLVGDEKLYRLGAKLQALNEKKEWGLGRRFGRSYFVFSFGNKRVFGVNLFGTPRLAVWGTETLESEFSKLDRKPSYYPVHRQWVFPRNTTVDSVREVLEAVYEKVRGGQQSILEYPLN